MEVELEELPLFLSDQFHPKPIPIFTTIKVEETQDHAFHDLLTHHLTPPLNLNPSSIDFDSAPPPFYGGGNNVGYFSGFDFLETKPLNNMMNPPLENFHGLFTNPLLYNPFVGPIAYRPPDEGSCTTVEINGGSLKDDGGRVTTRKKHKSVVVKGQWTIEEDRVLIELVESYGLRKWSQVAQMLNGRSGKQCRERWHNHLRPNIKKEIWSEEEDKVLIEAHGEIGNKWAEIAKKLPGRTENSIKNHWNATKRRQFCRRKCRSKYPKQSSLLQDYIKGLDLQVINAGCRKKSTAVILPPPPPTTTTTTTNTTFCSDFNVPEFSFEAAGLFDQESDDGAIESLFEEMGNYQDEVVKKELDLVEMINLI